MKIVMRYLLAALMLCCPLAFASATNVYVTPSGTAIGSCPTGTTSAPNLTGQIATGTTVLVCGSFTGTAGQANLLLTNGSGSSGNPIVINFDTGAAITSPYWGGGSSAAIAIVNSFVTLNMANLTISDTANGSGLTYTSLSISGLDSGAPQTFGISYSCGSGCLARPSSGGGGLGTWERTLTRPRPRLRLLPRKYYFLA